MNKEYWINKLKLCTDATDRVALFERTDNIDIIKIAVEHDVEISVIRAAINNKNCPADLVKNGQFRIDAMESHAVPHAMCPIPWNHIVIQQNGDLRACCQQIYHPYGSLSKNGQILNISTADIDLARNSSLLKDIRRSMLLNEQHPSCKLCWKEESNNLGSKREHMLLKYDISTFKDNTEPDGTIDITKFPLQYIDIRFGNLCNLKCRYCGPTDSSMWYEDYAALSGAEHNSASFKFYNSKEYTIHKNSNSWQVDSDDFKWYETDAFWNQIAKLMPYIDRYYFTGGEPTINKTHYRLLDMIVASGYSKSVYLEYNSNMVAIPDTLYATWEKFKGVGIGCSIDGIGKMANYLRPPAKWSALEKNVDYLGYLKSSTTQGSIATTISVYNVLHFLDLSKWLIEKNYTRIKRTPSYHILEGPTFMSIQVLPTEYKEHVKEQYENFFNEIAAKYSVNFADVFRKNFSGIINYMFAEDRSALLPKLAEHTHKLDNIRNHTLIDVNPWLAGVLHDEYAKLNAAL